MPPDYHGNEFEIGTKPKWITDKVKARVSNVSVVDPGFGLPTDALAAWKQTRSLELQS